MPNTAGSVAASHLLDAFRFLRDPASIGDPARHELAVTDQDLINVLDELAALSRRTCVDIRWRPVSADPDDDMVIACAGNGQANRITWTRVRLSLQCGDMLG